MSVLLHYYAGAMPGKNRKLSNEEKKAKQKEYESRHPPRKFVGKWKNGRFDHECFNFQTESINLDKLMFYLRELNCVANL
jgi:hypothetical protein